jgi:8-hydroxy-5-deazaflavin:NADPH oxidoreductase
VRSCSPGTCRGSHDRRRAAREPGRERGASLGYRPIDAGGLRMARTLEEMALLNIVLDVRNGWTWQTGWKLVGPTA